MASPSPLVRYLRVQQRADAELNKILREAANEAASLARSLAGQEGVGAQVRRAQFQAVYSALRLRQQQMWQGPVTTTLRRWLREATLAAAEAQNALRAAILRSLGLPATPLLSSMLAQAEATFEVFLARGISQVPLSTQVFRSEAFANELLARTINRSILLGRSWLELAGEVRSLIRPDVPGGVSYAAKRLGRTELNNAFHVTQVDQASRDPWVTGMKWNLSGSHPRPDTCDEYAKDTHYRGGDPGVFRVEDVPRKPHPQCFCFLTSEQLPPEEIIRQFKSGRYDDFLAANGY